MACPVRRLDTLTRHLQSAPAAGAAELPTPPVHSMPENEIFPSFPTMMNGQHKLGGLFSYEILGGRRMTVVADPQLFEIVFHPDEYGTYEGVGDAIKVFGRPSIPRSNLISPF